MTSVQNVFVTGEGQAGAYAELEKRKFTAEEGVRLLPPMQSPLDCDLG
jgi:ATP-dependent RNA helicase DDX35